MITLTLIKCVRNFATNEDEFTPTDEKKAFYAPLNVDSFEDGDLKGSCVRHVGEFVTSGEADVPHWYVVETPEQIAALFAAAEREARIRENAARLLAAFIVSGSELESTILHGVSGQHALSLERRLDEFFAAERAAKKTGEE